MTGALFFQQERSVAVLLRKIENIYVHGRRSLPRRFEKTRTSRSQEEEEAL